MLMGHTTYHHSLDPLACWTAEKRPMLQWPIIPSPGLQEVLMSMAAELDTENLQKAQHHKDKKQARRVVCMPCTPVSPVPSTFQEAQVTLMDVASTGCSVGVVAVVSMTGDSCNALHITASSWVTSAVMQTAAMGKRAHGSASKDAARRRSGVPQTPAAAAPAARSAESGGVAIPAGRTGGKQRWACTTAPSDQTSAACAALLQHVRCNSICHQHLETCAAVHKLGQLWARRASQGPCRTV